MLACSCHTEMVPPLLTCLRLYSAHYLSIILKSIIILIKSILPRALQLTCVSAPRERRARVSVARRSQSMDTTVWLNAFALVATRGKLGLRSVMSCLYQHGHSLATRILCARRTTSDRMAWRGWNGRGAGASSGMLPVRTYIHPV